MAPRVYSLLEPFDILPPRYFETISGTIATESLSIIHNGICDDRSVFDTSSRVTFTVLPIINYVGPSSRPISNGGVLRIQYAVGDTLGVPVSGVSALTSSHLYDVTEGGRVTADEPLTRRTYCPCISVVHSIVWISHLGIVELRACPFFDVVILTCSSRPMILLHGRFDIVRSLTIVTRHSYLKSLWDNIMVLV